MKAHDGFTEIAVGSNIWRAFQVLILELRTANELENLLSMRKTEAKCRLARAVVESFPTGSTANSAAFGSIGLDQETLLKSFHPNSSIFH
jgi:hypothetical protein